ncbi:hypothetical protein Tco_0689616 [Tanacetum coccineum]
MKVSLGPPQKKFRWCAGSTTFTADPVELERFQQIKMKRILTYSLVMMKTPNFLYLRKNQNVVFGFSLVPLADALQDRNMLLTYAQSYQNRLHVNPENVRLNVLMKLQEALDEEALLEEQILTLMHRFADRFTDRRVEINNLMVLQDHPLIDYGKYALGCMTGADMKKCVYLKSVRDELLRSMEEKRQLMTNYRDM